MYWYYVIVCLLFSMFLIVTIQKFGYDFIKKIFEEDQKFTDTEFQIVLVLAILFSPITLPMWILSQNIRKK